MLTEEDYLETDVALEDERRAEQYQADQAAEDPLADIGRDQSIVIDAAIGIMDGPFK